MSGEILKEGGRYLKNKVTGAVHVWHEQLSRHDDLLEFFHHQAGDKFIPKIPRAKITDKTISLADIPNIN